MTLAEIILRLGVATLLGGLIGLNRYAHRHIVGVRTLGLVALGSAAAVAVFAGSADAAAPSRIVQGILTGIGFIGAGVIMRDDSHHKVHGLTTAATVWVAALVGVLCGLAAWRLAIVTIVLVGLVLMLGGPLEKWLVRGEPKATEPGLPEQGKRPGT